MTSSARSSTSPNARHFLRAETASCHLHLEERLVLGREGATLEDLQSYLLALAPWVLSVNESVWSQVWPERLFAQRRREKPEWLMSDLKHWGMSWPQPEPIYLSMQSESESLGVAYVLEGMMLGGRALAHRFGPLTDAPVLFLEGYGSSGGELWKTFIDYLNDTLGSDLQRKAAAESARGTFRSLENWLFRCGVMRA